MQRIQGTSSTDETLSEQAQPRLEQTHSNTILISPVDVEYYAPAARTT
jgi:hypothetical protein